MLTNEQETLVRRRPVLVQECAIIPLIIAIYSHDSYRNPGGSTKLLLAETVETGGDG